MRWVAFAFSTVVFAAVVVSASQGDDLPAGTGKDAFLKMCASCHEIERATSARYPRKQWANVVDDMVSRGAEGSDAEVTAVVSYLSRNFGKPVHINAATAKEIESDLSFTAAESEAIVHYRTEQGAFKTYDDLSKVPGLNAKLLEEQKKNILF